MKKHFPSLRLLFVLFFIFCSRGNAQEQWYTAFAHDPVVLSDSLYKHLETSDISKKLVAITSIAEAHLMAGSTDSVLYYGNYLQDQVIRFKTDLVNSEDHLAKSYLILGYGRFMLGLNDEALKAFIEGIALENESTSDEMKLGLSLVYQETEKYDKALSLLNECLKSSNEDLRLRAKKYLADLLINKGEFDEADHLLKEVRSELDKTQKKLGLQVSIQQAVINTNKKEYDRAITTLNEVTNTSKELGFYDVYIASVIETGKIYTLLENYQVAQMILSTGHINSVNWNRLGLERDVIRATIRVNVAQEDYKNAYALMTQYVAVTNDIKKRQNKYAVRDLEMKYDTKVKENEILSLKETQLIKESELIRQKTIKNAILIGFLVLLIPVIGLLTLYYQKLQVQSKLNVQKEEMNRREVASLIKNQELKIVKAAVSAQNDERSRIAMELHDSIGGNLAAIKLRLDDRKEDQKDLIKQLDLTYQQVREISHNLTPSIFVENAFTTLVDDYLQNLENSSIEELKFAPFPKEKVDELDESYKIELFKILQELLTNTIKYAKAKSVEIHLNVFETNIQLLYEDNGVGFNVATVKNGIGITNIKKRIETLNGSFNMDSTVNRGTAVTIEIPLSL